MIGAMFVFSNLVRVPPRMSARKTTVFSHLNEAFITSAGLIPFQLITKYIYKTMVLTSFE